MKILNNKGKYLTFQKNSSYNLEFLLTGTKFNYDYLENILNNHEFMLKNIKINECDLIINHNTNHIIFKDKNNEYDIVTFDNLYNYLICKKCNNNCNWKYSEHTKKIREPIEPLFSER